MLAILVTIRDFLIAAALSWVGVTMETQVSSPERCAGEACDTAQGETR
jgi:hypothetical protein